MRRHNPQVGSKFLFGFSASIEQRVTSPPKYHSVDMGRAASKNPNPTPDLGRNFLSSRRDVCDLRPLADASPQYSLSFTSGATNTFLSFTTLCMSILQSDARGWLVSTGVGGSWVYQHCIFYISVVGIVAGAAQAVAWLGRAGAGYGEEEAGGAGGASARRSRRCLSAVRWGNSTNMPMMRAA